MAYHKAKAPALASGRFVDKGKDIKPYLKWVNLKMEKEQNVPSHVPGLVPSSVPSSSPNISRVLSFLPLACPTMKEADLTKALKIHEKWFAPKLPFFKKLESYFA